MAKRKNIGKHILGNKKNLVTKMDRNGGYDEYPCVNCGKIIRQYGLMRSQTWTGPCFVSKEQAEKIAIHKQKEKTEKTKEICGGWYSLKAKKICDKCKTLLIKCPEKGHPNSKYWALKRNDGCDLYVCPKGCFEEEISKDEIIITQKEKNMEKDNSRTVRDFVEDLLSEGRTPLMIRTVAMNCRWGSHLEEINRIIQEISGKFKNCIQL